MKKHLFIAQIKANLAEFQPLSHLRITINSDCFSMKEAQINAFITEIEQTAEALVSQQEVLHSEYYADRLLKQFDILTQAINKQTESNKEAKFHSSFQFSPRVHQLPPEKRLAEYRKALRALNEKISWLIEQNYATEDESRKTLLQNQIAETEHRKMNCLQAIEDLEQELQFR